jgi:hypothetical protein
MSSQQCGIVDEESATNESKSSDENRMVSEYGVVKMYYFAIDFGCEMPYPLAPPQGWEVQDISLKTSS